MKSFLLYMHQSSQGYLRKGIAVLLATMTLLLACNEAFGWVAAGGRGRGFAVAGRGYGCAGIGRYGAVGFRGGTPGRLLWRHSGGLSGCCIWRIQLLLLRRCLLSPRLLSRRTCLYGGALVYRATSPTTYV